MIKTGNRFYFFATALAGLALVSAAGCSKADDTGSSADSATASCLVGSWTASSTDGPGSSAVTDTSVTYTADNTFVKTSSNTTDNNYYYYSGTWAVSNGMLNLTYAKVGSSNTSLADAATAAGTPTNNGARSGYSESVLCSGSHYGTQVVTGGDATTLVGTWKSSGNDKIQMALNGTTPSVAQEVTSSTLVLNGDNKGSHNEDDSTFLSGSTWSTTPTTSSQPTNICSWSYDSANSKINLTLNQSTCGSGDLTFALQTLVSGSGMTTDEYFTKQ